MGKMKRPRQKLHNAAMKTKEKGHMSKDSKEIEMTDFSLMPPPPDPTALGARGDNLFSGLNINAQELTHNLPDFDARSSITSKTFRGQNLKKKDKQKLRHNAWMSKIDHIQTVKKEEKEKKKRQKTPVVGDMKPLEDALPTLELLLKKSSKETDKRQEPTKHRPTPKERQRKKQMTDDMALFKQILIHPLFVENSQAAIKCHLEHTASKR